MLVRHEWFEVRKGQRVWTEIKGRLRGPYTIHNVNERKLVTRSGKIFKTCSKHLHKNI